MWAHRYWDQLTRKTTSAIAFDFFLALIPMLALGAWALVRLVHTDAEALRQSSLLFDLTPFEARTLVDHYFAGHSEPALAPLAALSCWWLASSAFHTLIHVFQESFECEARSYVAIRGLSLGFALLGIALLVGGVALGVLLQVDPDSRWGRFLGNFSSQEGLRWLAMLAFLGLSASFFAVLYRFSLRRPFVRRVYWPGSFVASLGGVLASTLFGYYLSHIASFAPVYGSLVAVVVLLLWLLLWSHVLVLGAVVNVSLEDSRRPPGQE
jgi:membrane protein